MRQDNPLNPILQSLQTLLDPSFQRFLDFIKEKDIVGREQEMKNFYCSNILLKEYCSPDSVLNEYAQLVIEGSVPQIKEEGRRLKPQVNFDLLIWEKPNSISFDSMGAPVNFPLAILEWKVSNSWNTGGNRKGYLADKEKVQKYTAHFNVVQLLGYAIWLDHKERKQPYITFSSYYQGQVVKEDQVVR